MKCENCEVAHICQDPARFSGGCDMDGVDDFGCHNGTRQRDWDDRDEDLWDFGDDDYDDEY